jgi:hypothetical protein
MSVCRMCTELDRPFHDPVQTSSGDRPYHFCDHGVFEINCASPFSHQFGSPWEKEITDITAIIGTNLLGSQ